MLGGAMNTASNRCFDPTPTPAVEPDFSGFDTAEDMYRDAVKWGLDEKLRALLGQDHANDPDPGAAIRLAREIAYELGGAKNRDLAVDLFLHVTGLGEFGFSSLRDYGRKHGCSHEWIRREAEAMRERLDLPRRANQRSEKVRAEYRLVNRRNGVA
jgi:hypothetical protein